MSGAFYNAIEDISPSELIDTPISPIIGENQSKSYTKNELCCEVCDVKVTSMKILQRHLEGRKHKLRVERKDKTFVCESCEVNANSEIQLNIHLNSQKHKNKLARNDRSDFTTISPNATGLFVLLVCVICIFVNLLVLFKITVL